MKFELRPFTRSMITDAFTCGYEDTDASMHVYSTDWHTSKDRLALMQVACLPDGTEQLAGFATGQICDIRADDALVKRGIVKIEDSRRPCIMYIYDIGVAVTFKRNGLATGMLRGLCQLLVERISGNDDFLGIHLFSYSHAQPFYRRCGFQDIFQQNGDMFLPANTGIIENLNGGPLRPARQVIHTFRPTHD